jgi:hypothetical protein
MIDQVEKQVSKRFESLAKDLNLFFLPRKSPKDSNSRTRVRRLDSSLILVDLVVVQTEGAAALASSVLSCLDVDFDFSDSAFDLAELRKRDKTELSFFCYAREVVGTFVPVSSLSVSFSS